MNPPLGPQKPSSASVPATPNRETARRQQRTSYSTKNRILNQEDVASEVIFRLLTPKVAAKYDPAKGTFEQFKAGVARNVRREFTKQHIRARLGPLDFPSPKRQPETPYEAAVQAEAVERMWRAVQRLKPGDSEVVRRFYAGLAGAVGARGFTPAERCRLCRALKKLRIMLESVE